MIGFELVRRGEHNKDIRLTVTNDRVTLKVPDTTSDEDVAVLTLLSENIANSVRPVPQTLRGRIRDLNARSLQMLENNKHVRVSVKYDDNFNVTEAVRRDGPFTYD